MSKKIAYALVVVGIVLLLGSCDFTQMIALDQSYSGTITASSGKSDDGVWLHDQYRLSVTAGSTYRVTLTSNSATRVGFSLYDADGTEHWFDTSGNYKKCDFVGYNWSGTSSWGIADFTCVASGTLNATVWVQSDSLLAGSQAPYSFTVTKN